MNDHGKKLVSDSILKFERGNITLAGLQQHLEGGMGILTVENGRAHDAATKKFIGKLELISFTAADAAGQKEAALKVCEEVNSYLSAI